VDGVISALAASVRRTRELARTRARRQVDATIIGHSQLGHPTREVDN
jgi:hypothetical protein